jgi:hypothetical protein
MRVKKGKGKGTDADVGRFDRSRKMFAEPTGAPSIAGFD